MRRYLKTEQGNRGSRESYIGGKERVEREAREVREERKE